MYLSMQVPDSLYVPKRISKVKKGLAIPYIFILTSRAEVTNQKHEEQ